MGTTPRCGIHAHHHASFWIQLDEARDIVSLAGPNLHGRHLTYDGHRVVVSREVSL